MLPCMIDLVYRMNVEDEIFSELESLDTQVLMQKRMLVEQGEQLAQQGEQLAQQGEQLAQQGEQLAQKDEQLAASIKLMLSNGIPKALVAETLGISVTDIDAYNILV